MRAWVVVGVYGIDVGEPRQSRLHLALRFRLQPLAVRVEDDPDLRSFDSFINPSCRSMAGLRGHQPLQFHDSALAAQQLFHVLAGLQADLPVISTDKASVVVAADRAVQHDNRYPLLHRFRHWRRQRHRLLGGDDIKVHALLNELADLALLHVSLVLSIFVEDLILSACFAAAALMSAFI